MTLLWHFRFITAHAPSSTLIAAYSIDSAQTDQQKTENKMKKPSEQFLDISKHTAALENRAETTRAENRKEFDSHVSEARTRVQSFQDAFTARLDETEEALASQWRALEEAFQEQSKRAEGQRDQRKRAIDGARAKVQANDAEAYAAIAADFARLTAAEAEAAMVEAKEARSSAISLGKKTS